MSRLGASVRYSRYPNKLKVYKSGHKRGITPTIKKELRRRSAVEAVIGHLKTNGRLGRNFLKGRDGDKINAILEAGCEAWNRLVSDPNTITSIGMRNWAHNGQC